MMTLKRTFVAATTFIENSFRQICKSVLESHPTNLIWLRLLCCAMIHLHEIRPLLKRIDSYSDQPSIHNKLLFYKIYALYLMKDTEKANVVYDANINAINELPDDEQTASRYLHFQILYRLGSYQSALEILNTLDH